MKKHISIQRKDKTQKIIKDKMKVLKRYCNKGIPEGAVIPTNLASFRCWEDETLHLKKIGSPNTLNKLYNRALKQEIVNLLKKLAIKLRAKPRKPQTGESLKNQIKEYAQLVKDLTGQIHSTRHELDRVKQSERRLQNRVGDLTKELRTVTSFQAVKGE